VAWQVITAALPFTLCVFCERFPLSKSVGLSRGQVRVLVRTPRFGVDGIAMAFSILPDRNEIAA
jgi:hypothetical protein